MKEKRERDRNMLLFLHLIYLVSEVSYHFICWLSQISSAEWRDAMVVGPSSSHTVGPMRAGKIFIADLQELGLLEKVSRFRLSMSIMARKNTDVLLGLQVKSIKITL